MDEIKPITNAFSTVPPPPDPLDNPLPSPLSVNGPQTVSNGGGNVVDGQGLVSTTNFNNNDVFNGSAGLSTGSTSLVDVAGSSLAAFTLSRPTNVLIVFMAYGNNSQAISSEGANSMLVEVVDVVSGVPQNIVNINLWGTLTTYTPDGVSFNMSVHDQLVARTSIIQLDKGSHILKLQYRAVGGGTAFLDAFELGYVILGT